MIKFPKSNIILGVVLVMAFSLFGVGQAQTQATGDLSVQFSGEPGPMFNVSNFLPGDNASGWAAISNASPSSKKVVVWTTNWNNPLNGKSVRLGDVLTISIKRQGEASPFYSKSLTDFINEQYVTLDNLGGGNSETYDFNIYFDVNAGNDYQGAVAGFSLNIGSWSEYQNESPSGYTRFSSGGTPYFDFKIINVTSSVASLPEGGDTTDATVEWDTNAEATTQIIFSRQDQPHALTIDSPYYGYANVYPLPADSSLTFHHKVFLSGLTPCSTYYYRVVSHMTGRGDTVSSPEQSFVTACLLRQEPEQNQEGDGSPEGQQGSGQRYAYLGGSPDGPGNPEDQGQENNIGGDEEQQNGTEENKNGNAFDPRNWMAAIGNFFNFRDFGTCWPNFPWWIFLIFMVYPIIKGFNYWNESKKKSLIFFLSSLIPVFIAVWAFFKKYLCLPWWLLILMFAATIVIWLADRRKKPADNK